MKNSWQVYTRVLKCTRKQRNNRKKENMKMKKYSKRQLNAISYAKSKKQHQREEEYLKSVGKLEEYQSQTKYKTMRGFINYITDGKYFEAVR